MEHFKSNKDYIKAVFTQFMKLPASRSAPAPQVRSSLVLPASVRRPVATPPGSEHRKIREQLLKIYKRGREAVKNRVNIPAERIAAKNSFDDIEKTIMLLTLYLGAETRKLTWEERDELRLVAEIFSLNTIDLYKYYFRDSRLNRARLFSDDNGFRERFTALKPLRPEIIEELLSETRPKNKKRVHPSRRLSTPAEICGKLDETVIAQTAAKKKLSAVAFQHINRSKNSAAFAAPRLNVILIGPTGCGKTYMVRKLAGILNKPVAFCDATQYSETGYVGANVEEMLVTLHKAGGKNPDNMAGGIIYIDEIDKIAAGAVTGGHNSCRDVSGRSVQEELLKLLEGDVINYSKIAFRGINDYQFNVADILFIASGAFSGIEDVIRRRIGNKNRIGFTPAGGGTGPDTAALLPLATPQDIISYGFIPEFIGRFPNIITLDKLTQTDFVSILTNPRTSLFEHYRAFFRKNNIELEIPDEFATHFAEKAAARDLGARGLNAIVEGYFSNLVFELMSVDKLESHWKVNIMDYAGDKEFSALAA